MSGEIIKLGEERHTTCIHGTLTPAYKVSRGVETAALLPLCLFKPAGDLPPALRRVWSGLVEYDRDCAVCPAHTSGAEPLPPRHPGIFERVWRFLFGGRG